MVEWRRWRSDGGWGDGEGAIAAGAKALRQKLSWRCGDEGSGCDSGGGEGEGGGGEGESGGGEGAVEVTVAAAGGVMRGGGSGRAWGGEEGA